MEVRNHRLAPLVGQVRPCPASLPLEPEAFLRLGPLAPPLD